MTFVDTKLFTELVLDYLSDDDYAAMQQFLVVNPEASDAVGSVEEFSAWRSPVLHDHDDHGVELSLGLIDVG